MAGEEFVHVKLSAAGAEAAGSGELRVVGASYEFAFRAGASQRVTRAGDWDRVLSRETLGGELLFELAETEE